MLAERLDSLSTSDEMLGLAKELLSKVKLLNDAKPEVDIQSSMKGLGAVIRELDVAGGALSPSELAERTRVSDARIANILRVLQDRGLVERKQSVDDKRRAIITLTEAGKNDCAKRKADLERAVAAFLTRLGEEDSRELVRLIGKMQETLMQLRSEGFEPRPPMEVEITQEGQN